MTSIRRTATRLALAGVTALTATAVTLTTAATAAHATAITTRPTITATIDGPTAAITATIVSTSRVGASRTHLVTLTSPDARINLSGAWTESTQAERRTGVIVAALTGKVHAADLTAGAATWAVRDLGDGRSTQVRVETRRRAYLDDTRVFRAGRGRYTMVGSTRSTAPDGWGYLASQGVPVQVQRATSRGWVTVGTVRSDRWGGWVATVRVPAGTVLRAHRAQAVLSTAADSPRVVAR